MSQTNGSRGLEIVANGKVAGEVASDLIRSGALRPVVFPPAYKPFPVPDLPEPLRTFVRDGAVAIGPSCDPASIALPALSVVASLIGATYTIVVKRTWKEPAVLWSVIVGDSGTLKSPAMMLAVNPLIELQCRLREEYQRELRAHNKTVDEDGGADTEPPTERRVMCSDTSIEAIVGILADSPSGCLLWADELDAWFQSFKRYKSGSGGSDRPHWLSIHGARPVIYDRKTGDRRSVIVPRAAVSVTGGIQPAILAQALDGCAMESGLGARLLLAHPPDTKKRWTEAELSPEIETAYSNLLTRLANLNFRRDMEGRPKPNSLRMSSQARAMWIDYFNEWAEHQFAAEGQLRAAFSKIEAYAVRLALIIHVVNCVHRNTETTSEVSADAMAAGINLANWFANEARRVYQMLGESEDSRRMRRLVEWVRQQGGRVTARELRRSSPSKYQTTEDAVAALTELEERKLGHWEPKELGKTGGRPTEVFVLFGSIDD